MQWRKTIGWTAVGLVVCVVVLCLGGYFFLKSGFFKNYAIGKIQQAVAQSTGGRAQIQSLGLELSSLTARLNNVTIHGTEIPSEPPLLHVDELTVSFKIESIVRRKVTLSELRIDHPVVNLHRDWEGNTNLPHSSSTTSGHTNVFELAVKHALLDRGEINYNDQKTPMEADLRNLNVDLGFEPLVQRYAGSISYDQGDLVYGQYEPLPHSFNAQFSATRSLFSLKFATLKLGSSELSLRGDVTDYSNPTATGNYTLRLHTQDLWRLSTAARPTGDVVLAGTIRYQSGDQPLLRNVNVQGQLQSEDLSVASQGRTVSLRRLRGVYEMSNGTFQARKVEAETLGGLISTEATVRHLDATPEYQVQALLRGISLPEVERSVHAAMPDGASVSSTLDGTAVLSWSGSANDLIARSDLSLHSARNSQAISEGPALPVDGVLHATYDARHDTVTVRQSVLRLASTSITADGKVGDRSQLQVLVKAPDLQQIAELASRFSANPSSIPPMSGTATLSAVVRGSLHKPEISGTLNSQNLQVQGSDWKSADGTFAASPSHFAISNASLISAKQGTASFSGTVSLRNWSFSPSSAIDAKGSVRQASIADLLRLANQQYPLSGNLSADLSFKGSQLAPSGSGSLQITNGKVYDEPLQNAALQFHAADGSIKSTLNASIPAGSSNADLTYTPRSRAYTLHFNSPGVALEKLRAIQQKNLQIRGAVALSANGSGTLDNPQLSVTLQSTQIDVHQKAISGLKADVQVANHRANLVLDSEVVDASVRARAQVNLSDGYYTEASLDTTVVPLDVLLATFVSSVPEGFHGDSEYHVTLKGPLKDKSRVEAHVVIPTLKATYQSLDIGAAGPIRLDYTNSVVNLQPVEFRGTGTSLKVEGRLPLEGKAPPTLTANGSVDARILRIVSPDLRSSGVVGLSFHATRSSAGPEIEGQAHLQNIALFTPGAPLGVEKLNGTVSVSNNRIEFSDLNGQVGGGKVQARGTIAYRPDLQFNVVFEGNSIRLLYPDGLRTVMDCNLALTGTKTASALNGRVLVDTLSFTPDFDLASFGDQFTSSSATPAEPGLLDTVQLAVGVQSKSNLSATSSQVSVEGNLNLRVIGTAANPVITGRTDLTAGELFYRNVRYQLQRGIITFDNPNETSPTLNVSATTTIEQYNLTLNLRGPLDKLTTTYTSDPPLASADIINLIARGQTTEESAAASQSTDSMIASQAASQVSSGVQKLAGISSLQIDPLFGGNNQNPSARVAIQQRVTKDFLFTFSTDVSQPGNEIVQGDYQINHRWSVSVARDQTGGVSIDGRYHTRF